MNPLLARIICAVIPAACPFARTFTVGKLSVTVPPVCKINPFYDKFMELRFQALTELSK
jgi:hypothetical protein